MKVKLNNWQIENILSSIQAVLILNKDKALNGLTRLKLSKASSTLTAEYKDYLEAKEGLLKDYYEFEGDKPKRDDNDNLILKEGKEDGKAQEAYKEILQEEEEVEIKKALTDKDFEQLDMTQEQADWLSLISID